jgi:hypothetical protein
MLGPPDGASRRLGQPTARRTPDDGIAKGTVRIPDRGDGADPRAIGELLQTWIGVKLDEVDGLVDEARQKAAAIPEWRVIAQLVGELVISQHALEVEVASLRAEVARLREVRR